ncbi:SGNH/GDSL hydrolase family protein [Chitinophaga sp.]|uniref:SGNH/GDSL hydrolase family protein n=1 Tax=Chitinophaga sp. TaxID=1869181 RepID=UPI0031D520DF
MNSGIPAGNIFAAVKRYLYRYFALATLFIACGKNENADIKDPGTNPSTPTNPAPSKADSATIVIIGSSTAAGMGASPSDSSWVNRLILSTKNNKRILTYYNLGIIGLTTYQGIPKNFTKPGRPATDTLHNITAALSFHPSLVIMSYPTNDVAYDYTDDEIMDNFNEMIRLLDSAKVKYIVFGTQPRNFPDVAYRTRLKTLNVKMQAAFGGHFSNVYDTLAAEDGTIRAAVAYGDGVHVNNTGHDIIYHKIADHAVFQEVIK